MPGVIIFFIFYFFLQDLLQEFIVWLATKCNMFFIKLCNDDALKLSGIWKHERLQKQCQHLKGEYRQNYWMGARRPEGNLPFITAWWKSIPAFTNSAAHEQRFNISSEIAAISPFLRHVLLASPVQIGQTQMTNGLMAHMEHKHFVLI